MRVRLTNEQLSSKLIEALSERRDESLDTLRDKLSINTDTLQQHDKSHIPIAWNDVQAIRNFNKYILRNTGALLKVPETATEGYNQHYHTSEFDGGVLPGAKGIHNHLDNVNGGFAFAVFHPGTEVPIAKWE